MIGKIRRLSRLFSESSGRILMVPLDHGVTSGPILGLERMGNTVRTLIDTGVNALVMHKGMICRHMEELSSPSLGLVMHLSAGTAAGMEPDRKILTGTVEEALTLGCDAVSVHVNLGALSEAEMLRDLGSVSSQCMQYGVPLLAIMYPQGLRGNGDSRVAAIRHAARVGAELGADLVKVAYTGDVDSFAELVASCPVPVLVAGGSKLEEEVQLFRMIGEALEAGARGISIGRNIFQSRNTPQLMTAIQQMLHTNVGWESAYHEYRAATLSGCVS